MLLFIAFAVLWGQHADWFWYVIAAFVYGGHTLNISVNLDTISKQIDNLQKK